MKFSRVQADMTMEEAAKIQSLFDRDIAKPCIVVKTNHSGKDYQYLKCPVCDEVVVESAGFCMKCGQRIDKENVAF